MRKNIKLHKLFNSKSVSLYVRTFLFLLSFSILSVNAQIDSIASSLRMKPKFGLKMENKNFLLDDQFSRIQEFKPYLEFGNRLRLGLGYCWLPDNHHYLPNNDSMYINIGAIGFFGAYLININDDWAAEIPVDFGWGTIKSKYLETIQNKGHYSFYEPSFIVEYKGFKFFNLGLGTGFRYTTNNRLVYSKNLSIQTIILRFNLKFTEIYQHLLQQTNS